MSNGFSSKDSDNVVSDDSAVVTEVKDSGSSNGGGGGGLLAGIFNLITGGFRVAQDQV